MNEPSRQPLVSAIIAACNEAPFIEEVLQSVINQRTDSFNLEVLVISNGSTDDTPAIVHRLAQADPRIKALRNATKSTPAAFNAGIRAAQGDYVCILGAHAFYPPEYISICLQQLELQGTVGCSGKIITESAGGSRQSRLCAWATAHPFCSSGSSVRTQREGFVDTIPFPVMRRAAVLEAGGYDEAMLRNQDNDLNQRLRARGHKLYLTEKVQASYYARSTIREMWSWGFNCGRWNAISLWRNPASLRPRHLVPLGFVLAIALLASITLIGRVSRTQVVGSIAAFVLLLTFGAHLLLGTIAGAQVAIREKAICAIWLPLVILGFHLAYGTGTLFGLFQRSLRRSKPSAEQQQAVGETLCQ